MSIRLIHLASGNPHKAQELQRLAKESPALVRHRLGDGGSRRLQLRIVATEVMPEVVEDAGTFAGNARKKAVALRGLLPADAWVLADDGGVCVDALGGAPGVESAYYAGPDGDMAANLRKLVEVTRGVPEEKRGAHFLCMLVLLGPGEVERVFEGRCAGRLRREPAGAGGFGYDPLFIPDGYEQTYAELGDEVKNRISHRSAAWRKLAEWVGSLQAGL